MAENDLLRRLETLSPRHGQWKLGREAAAEIRRLREDNHRWQQADYATRAVLLEAWGETRDDDPNQPTEVLLENTAKAFRRLREHQRTLAQKWRANADMLAEGNKNEWPDPAVSMQRACADELSPED